jgi:hypothetical protein
MTAKRNGQSGESMCLERRAVSVHLTGENFCCSKGNFLGKVRQLTDRSVDRFRPQQLTMASIKQDEVHSRSVVVGGSRHFQPDEWAR